MEPPAADGERYAADYGNLLLEIPAVAGQEETSFQFRVTDKRDGLICWIGTASTLAAAQAGAMFEAEVFLDPCLISPTPSPWRRVSARD